VGRSIWIIGLLAAAIVSGGCGSEDETSPVEAPGKTTTVDKPKAEKHPPAPKKGAWGVAFGAEGEELGLILYDLAGHTLYTFSKDKGGASSCYGACAKKWPPALTEGRPKAGGEAVAGKVGAIKRKDKTRQLTYAGHPLYTFSGDKQAETNGNGLSAFGGEWYAIRPNGQVLGG
jgi:predicted lipoprotein with Yx(FWY)xxD motif